ncbi:MAG: hypothetical protein P4L79_13240 [Legionella sp.]|uniref:hypothetical protein n=1 Tax=Legionella sp. TaxID=459 RepID=UPI00284C0B88|nr:hypothetical protein [Legionella sp.]
MGSKNGKPLFGKITDLTPVLEDVIKLFGKLERGYMEHFEIIKPKSAQQFPLKKQFKPDLEIQGEHTLQLGKLKKNEYYRLAANKKMNANLLYGQHYENDEGAVKLHISMNDILHQDAEIVQELIEFLAAQQQDPNANFSFKFKIVKPGSANAHARFQQNDQFTLYFDKYSSVSEVMALGNKIDEFLKSKGIKENQHPLGPKDSFGINSFVSIRTDTSKITAKYAEFKFFDLELKKFYESNKDKMSSLAHVPMAVFETVFNSILIDSDIKHLNSSGLSDLDSQIVQRRLKLIVENPQRYINDTIALIADSRDITMQIDFSVFDRALEKLAEKEKDLRQSKETPAADAAHILHEQLIEEKNKCITDGYPPSVFVGKCTALLQDAEKGELSKVRGVLGKIASALLFLVSFGQASVKTDSIKKLEGINSSLHQVGFFSSANIDTDNSGTPAADNQVIAPKR